MAALRPGPGLHDARGLLRAARDAVEARHQHRHLRRAPAACATTSSAARTRPPTPADLEHMKALVARGHAGGRARAQLVAAVRARPVRDHRRDRRTGEGGAALRRRLPHAPALRERRRSSSRWTRRSAVAERAKIPAEIWHLKTAYKANWGRMPEVLAPHRGGPRARPRRHGEPVSLHARVERPRLVPAAVGARGQHRADARAAEGPGAARARSSARWTTRTRRAGRTSGTARAAATA